MARRASSFSKKAQLPLPVRDVIEKVGDFIQFWGFRKIDGSIWALLFLSSRSLSGQEVADRLGFSKGMVSLSLQALLEHGVIQEEGRGAGRTIYYRSTDDLEGSIINVLRNREQKLLDEVGTAASKLKAKAESAAVAEDFSAKQIQELNHLVDRGQNLLQLILSAPLLK